MFYTVVYEEDIEYYAEEVVNPLVDFQVAMSPAADSTIEVVSPPVEAEEPLKSDQVKNWEWQSWRWSYTGVPCQKMAIRLCFVIKFWNQWYTTY